MFTKPHEMRPAPPGMTIKQELAWPKEDNGCWGFFTDQNHNSGPIGDWVASHQSVIERIIRKDVAIQAGGACGMYPLYLSQYFNKVYTFEPTSNYEFVLHNTRDVQNIILQNMGLSDEKKELYFTENRSNVGMNRVTTAQTPLVNTVYPIDELTFNGSVDLLWLDIEGHEYHALKGAKLTIEKHMPVIGVENATHNCVDFLQSLGYQNKIRSKMDTFFFRDGDLS